MDNESLKNPIILALALRPALATAVVFRAVPLENHYDWLMAGGLVMADTILFAWLVREVGRMKASASSETDEATSKD